MLWGLDPRLLLAAGLTCTAFAVYLNSEYTTAWSAANYYRTELLTGVGQSVSLIGLVGCIILQGIFTGGLAKPPWILTFSAFFHTIRLFGGTAGAIYMAHFLDEREKLHSNLLGLHVTSGNWITNGNLNGLAAGVYAKSPGMAAAGARAAGLIGARLRLQAYSLSLIDGFLLVAWTCAIALLFVALLRKSPLNYGDLSTLQPVKETRS
jgi:DHA2 family multidrug resistance protein